MILPYDGNERESRTPSPPSQLVYLTNLNARYNSADPSAGSSAAPGNRPKKNFSRNAWTHEEVNASRRLSDIGEELSPARVGGFDEGRDAGGRRRSAGSAAPRGQVGAPSTQTRDHQENNAAGSSSSSTVSVESARDLSSKGVSSPQSASGVSPNLAEAAEESHGGDEVKAGLPDSSVIVSAAKGKGPGEDFSSAILSSEAERILENAKKRLTVRDY